jgi:hypothetical protein
MTEISGGPSLVLDLDGSLLKDEKCAWMACFCLFLKKNT